MTFAEQYERYRTCVESALPGWIPQDIPEPLRSAMVYSLLAGGKRIRPVLLLAVCEEGEVCETEALRFACALEMVHTYSLIHDDLPGMDDDDLRRGRPTCHKVYGEGMAILAGDGLLSLAFEIMAASPHPRALEALRCLADRCGTRGMVAGQCADLRPESTGDAEAELQYTHLHKTADLLTAPLEMGAALTGADEALREAGRCYGRSLGLAFQIVDDLLDVTGDISSLGKQTGRDAELGKRTWTALRGLEQARKDAEAYTGAAERAADQFQRAGWFLKALARSALERVQ